MAYLYYKVNFTFQSLVHFTILKFKSKYLKDEGQEMREKRYHNQIISILTVHDEMKEIEDILERKLNVTQTELYTYFPL